jgi:predicted ferric reductase
MKSSFSSKSPLFWLLTGLVLIGALGLVAAAVLFISQTGLSEPLGQLFSWLLALPGGKATWYITRSAGLIAYLLLWLSTAWGLAVPSRILNGVLHGSFTFEFHEFISLLAIGFTAVHVGILLFDQYAPFSLLQLALPFIADYRPLWTGIGILSLYLVLLVTVTFYLLGRIGMKAFRAIHMLSLLGYLGATLHGFMAGTDSSLPAVQLLYGGTFLTIVFLLTYWLVEQATRKTGAKQALRPGLIRK